MRPMKSRNHEFRLFRIATQSQALSNKTCFNNGERV